jgi:hypothetical protein
MRDEVIPKQQLVAVTLKTFFHHVDMMCVRLGIALHEPGIERQASSPCVGRQKYS